MLELFKIIDGKPLYESLDIIQWLKEHPEK